jgi:dolichol-phosphate mannosyltransferase
MRAPRCSLVVPFYQEAGNVRPLMERACAVLAQLDPDYEALLIDDGSTDATAAELAAEATAEPRCRVITLDRNRGQAAALWHGLQLARGQFLLTMDGDGQNDPGDFASLLTPVKNGQVDLMCGWRTARHDSSARRVMSRLGNSVRRAFLRDGIHDAGCQLRVLRREVVAALLPSPMMQAFLPAMAVSAGFRVGEIPVRHHPRQRGFSKYGLRQLWLQPFREMLRLRRVLRDRAKRGDTPTR